MIYAAIVAGGSGLRMGGDLPKQFMMLGEYPILIHTIKKFLATDEIFKVYIGVNSEWIDYTYDLLRDYKLDLSRLEIVAGGENRNATVFNITNKILSANGLNKDDIILTHDGVRPFVTQKIINDNISAMAYCDACTTAIGAVDTILYSEDNESITSTPARNKMYHAQTPQTFNIAKLLEVYSTLSIDEKDALTDTCSIFTTKNLPVKIATGNVSNIKITTPYDIKIAQMLI